jgi:hypothetical protein
MKSFQYLILPVILLTTCELLCGQNVNNYWPLDSIPGSGIMNMKDSVIYNGNLTQSAGVKGKSLRFDGFTTFIEDNRAVKNLDKGFTIQGWIAPQEYSWGWTGIVDQAEDTTSGFSFGINYDGQIGFQAHSYGVWNEIISAEAVPLLQWSHVAGVCDPENGFKVFINGKLVASSDIRTTLRLNPGLPLVIGKAQRKQYPALTERKNSM